MRLDFENVTAGYGGSIAIRDVSLTVPSGSVAALLGPNGAGKTTLLKAASGLLPVTSGRIVLDGTDITSSSIQARRQYGLQHIPEWRAIFPSLTVMDNLRMFASAGRESEVIELAVAAFPRLGQRLQQIAGTMSGGEQQMLALSRAYGAGEGGVILLDEVSMGLAPIIIDEIFGFLRRLADGGATILVVEQYVDRALELADLVYLLARGGLTFAGEVGHLSEGELLAGYLAAGDDDSGSGDVPSRTTGRTAR